MHQKVVWIKMKRLGPEGIIIMAPEGDCLALNKSIFCWVYLLVLLSIVTWSVVGLCDATNRLITKLASFGCSERRNRIIRMQKPCG